MLFRSLFLLWVAVMAMVAIVSGRWPWFGLYALATFSGLKLYYRVKKLAVAVHNGLRYPELRPQVLAFRETVLRETAYEFPSPALPARSKFVEATHEPAPSPHPSPPPRGRGCLKGG